MRIGIFGGAFDPIHNGHLALAEQATKKLQLDQLIFVPSCKPPLKSSDTQFSGDVRIEMIRESVKGNSRFQVSDIELKREGVSYTIDTIQAFRKKFPQPNEIFLIVGSDWASRLYEWKKFDEILALCHVVVASRPGFQKTNLPKGITYLDFEAIDISASKIRDMIQKKERVAAWIPKPAYDIIQKSGLYLKS